MKTWIVIGFVLGLALGGRGQGFTLVEQSELDSLNIIVNDSTSHDTSRVIAYVELSNLYSVLNIDTMITFCEKAKDIANNALSKNPVSFVKTTLLISLATSLNNIGYVYNNHGNFSKALDYYLRSLKIRKDIEDQEGISESINNIAYIYNSRGDVSKALEYYRKSLKICNETKNDAGIALGLHNIGMVYDVQGDLNLAIEHFQKSLAIRERIGDKQGIAESLSTFGYIYNRQGDIAKGLEYYHKSLKIYEGLGNKRGIASCFNHIGYVYTYQRDYDEGLKYFNKSLRIREEITDRVGIAYSLNNIAYVYLNQKKVLKALEYFHKCLKIHEEIGDKHGMAYGLNNIGYAYNSIGDISKGLKYFEKSLKIRKAIVDKRGVAECLASISSVYFANGQLIQAEIKAQESLHLSEELGYPENIKSSSSLLYSIYSKSGNYKKALDMFELSVQMRDSINNESTQKAAIKQNMQYEYEKQHLSDSLQTSKELALKDIEISKQQAEAKAERTTKYGLFVGLALVLVIALVLFRSVKQKKKANEEILAQKKEVEESKQHIEQLHKEVTDSIHYAAHIQNAILTSDAYWQRMLDNHFILFKPRDIVSGDFYWAYETPSKKKIWIAADCTGHGVPGGFMSMLGNTFLNEIVIEQGEENASQILNKLRDHIIKALASDVGSDEGLEMKDGMDLALCILHSNNVLEYSGANNPLWILNAREEVIEHTRANHNEAKTMFLHEVKADKQPIGKYMEMTQFTSHKIQLEKGDQVYTFSDGFPDQFGGPKLKKYMSKKLKKFLLSIAEKTMEEQKELLLAEFDEWRKDTEQVDDVCIIGVKV